ncbi:unnamed protein product [Ectocarpus sp. CCAP 1310/34]|nr:unnamed protein product [Ectocarpus sp. CCAP 1310/34]
MHCCLSNSKLLAMRGGSGAPAHTHSRLLEKKGVLLAASRSGSGYPKKTSLAQQTRRSLEKGGGIVENTFIKVETPQPEAGAAAAVSKPGKCERMLWLGNQTHIIQHEWRPDNSRGEVLLITTLVDKKCPNRSSNK